MGGLHQYEKDRQKAIKKNGYKKDLWKNPGLAEKIADYDRIIEENQKRLDNPAASSAKTLLRAEENIKNAIKGRQKLLEDMKAKDM